MIFTIYNFIWIEEHAHGVLAGICNVVYKVLNINIVLNKLSKISFYANVVWVSIVSFWINNSEYYAKLSIARKQKICVFHEIVCLLATYFKIVGLFSRKYRILICRHAHFILAPLFVFPFLNTPKFLICGMKYKFKIFFLSMHCPLLNLLKLSHIIHFLRINIFFLVWFRMFHL